MRTLTLLLGAALCVCSAAPRYGVQGFAQATTGGGPLDPTDPAYRQVYDAAGLVAALGSKTTRVIEIMNDLDLGYNEVPEEARTGALRSASKPLLHPTLIASGVSLIDIADKDSLTIFSSNGATIRHATFNIKRTQNLIVRNLKFDELWEWDEASKGNYDKQGWDFITVDMRSDNVWIDHCTFTKSYDGAVDVKGGSRNVTISWCAFLGADIGPGSFVRRQIDALEATRSEHPMYDYLRSNGLGIEDILAVVRPQKKGHLVGANELDESNAEHRVTLHHNYYRNMEDRMPRLRAGNAHAFNLLVDNTEALAAKDLRDRLLARVANPKGYSFDVTLNGAISTEGGAVLVEKSMLTGVLYPLRNNQKNPADPEYTGKILALDTVTQLRGTTFRGDSTESRSPLQPVPAPLIEFRWNGFDVLPYDYTADDPADLPALLTGAEGAGAGTLLWTAPQWLQVSSELNARISHHHPR